MALLLGDPYHRECDRMPKRTCEHLATRRLARNAYMAIVCQLGDGSAPDRGERRAL
jgi:hypothetical protein